jgi:hypothetical protein
MRMKGKILGFNEAAGSGAITAEDGSRHSFTRADWRGEKPPAAGMTVDFESAGGQAKEIYPLMGAAAAALNNLGSLKLGELSKLGELAHAPQGAKVATLFTQSLSTPLALLVLLACVLPAISSPIFSGSLFSLGKLLDNLSAGMNMAAMFGVGESGSSLGMAKVALYLRFAAPLAALWLIWTAWVGKAERVPALVTGAASIVAALLVVVLRSSALSELPDFVRSEVANSIGLGIGVWLLFLVGAALIAAGFGKLRNPLAKA